MTWQSGGGGSSLPDLELGYAQITASFITAVANDTLVPGLSITITPDAPIKYAVEFMAASVSEDSGSTIGDLVIVAIIVDGNLSVMEGTVVQGVNGEGGALFIRSGDIVADGNAHTYAVKVTNVLDINAGVGILADDQRPCYIRAARY